MEDEYFSVRDAIERDFLSGDFEPEEIGQVRLAINEPKNRLLVLAPFCGYYQLNVIYNQVFSNCKDWL